MISAKFSFGKGIKIVLCGNMFVINSFTSLPFDIFRHWTNKTTKERNEREGQF